jgi:hypothetical protein
VARTNRRTAPTLHVPFAPASRPPVMEWGAQPPTAVVFDAPSNTSPDVSSEGAGNGTRGACAPLRRSSFRQQAAI